MAAPKLRFKEFDGDWISKKIIDLADYVDYRGKTPKKVESGILLVTAKNIKQGYLDYSASQEFIEESAFDDVMRRGKVELNDVLITTEAPLGNVASVDRTDIALAQRVIKYRGKIGLLDNLFLKQKFLSESFQEILKSKATGGTVQGIKGSVLHQIPLIVPSKEEQTKIASFLSAVDEKISQLTQKHELLSQYKQGMMQKLFSQEIRFKADDGSEFGEWEERKLSEISQKAMYGMNAAATEYDGINKYLRITDICEFSNSFKIDNLTSPNAELDDKYKLQLGDLLFARTGASVGKSYLYKKNDGITYFAGFLIKFSLNTNLVIPYFIFLQTLTKGFSQWVVTNSMRSGQPGINAEEYSSYIFKVPCLEEQTKIANFLSAIDQKIDVVSEQLEQAKLWKKGLLQQMFV